MKRTPALALLFGAGLLAGSYLSPWNHSSTIDNPALGGGGGMVGERPGSRVEEKLPVFSAANSDAREIVSALVSAVRDKEYLKGRVALYRLIEQIRPSDFAAVFDSAQQLPLDFRTPVIAALLERWCKVDPVAAGAWGKAHSSDEAYATAWAQSEPLAALTALLASDRSTSYWNATQIALDQLAGSDPKARIALLTSLPDSPNRDWLLSAEIEKLAQANPAEALRATNALQAGRSRDRAVRSVLLKWAQSDPTAAIAQLETMLPDLKLGLFGNALISEFTVQMAEKNPSAAIKFAADLPDGLRKYPLLAAATALAKADPLGALSWSVENGVDLTLPYRTENLTNRSVLRVALETKPSEVADWLLALPESPERQQLLKGAFESIIWGFVSGDFSITPGSPTSRLFDSLPLTEQRKYATRVGSLVVKTGVFPEASEWQTRFPDEELRVRAIAGAVGAIFSQSAVRAEELLAGISDPKTRDFALQELAYAQFLGKPSEAVARALRIVSKDVQRSTLDRVIPEWIKSDEAACRAWLDSNSAIPASWAEEWIHEAQEP